MHLNLSAKFCPICSGLTANWDQRQTRLPTCSISHEICTRFVVILLCVSTKFLQNPCHPLSHILHDDVIKWKFFSRYWPFVQGIHRSSVNSPHKGQWCGGLMFSLICAWINGWVNNREAGDLRRHRAHCDVTVVQDGFTGSGTTLIVGKLNQYQTTTKHKERNTVKSLI